ncbi:MAG: hypothetical protein L3J53_03595 [Proteobacteria bacterium]|nr:hypothetical protein [Pseudomonadota bacterium]
MTPVTLHLCNLDEINSFASYKSFINNNDDVVFYAKEIKNKQKTELLSKFSKANLFFVSLSNLKSYSKLVELVNKSARTMTWK